MADPTGVSATDISDTQIDIDFTTNNNNDNVILVWNLTGTFILPTGSPPSVGQPFAGGTLIYNGTSSPFSHSGLIGETTYYYKLFSYDNTNYSTGIEVNATTQTPIPTFQLTVSISDGWNMVSAPGNNPDGQGVNNWWEGKDPLTDVFKFDNGYQAVTSVIPGEGYWMKHLGSNLYNTGDEWPAGGIEIVPHDPIDAAEGWGLMGVYECPAAVNLISTIPVGLITGPIYGYSNGYQIVDSLYPGYGYWIQLSGTGQIILPSCSSTQNIIASTEYIKNEWGKIILTDNAGRSYTLYAVNEEVDLNLYQLPPMPPSGMFDIRFGSGRMAENINGSVKSIEMSGIEYPLKMKSVGMDIRLQDITGNELNVIVKSGEEVTISSQAVNKLMVSGSIVPDKYSLEQNYPNPFNPGTTIEFSLPEDAGSVKLMIYNALGEKIAELVNGTMQAGRYRYEWNAKNISTGMYIYELRANNFVSVKKMLFLK